MTVDRAVLNHGGSSPDNPILSGAAIRLRLAKQDANETLRKIWVTVGKRVFIDLTGLAVVTDYQITADVIAGTHLSGGSPSVRNVIHFTTESHRHAQVVVWCAAEPPVMITLDGYDGSNYLFPVIYPLLNN